MAKRAAKPKEAAPGWVYPLWDNAIGHFRHELTEMGVDLAGQMDNGFKDLQGRIGRLEAALAALPAKRKKKKRPKA